MICPKCHGDGMVLRWGAAWNSVENRIEILVPTPCDYPGCHNGQIACCDGLMEQMAAESRQASAKVYQAHLRATGHLQATEGDNEVSD